MEMLLLNEDDISRAGEDWERTAGIIERTVHSIADQDYSQPVKLYLRYRDKRNRIIAMPAFVGGDTEMAGVKWIASFPGNIDKGIPRASCVILLNNARTGQPVAMIHSGLVSVIRTASVSGLIIKCFEKNRNPGKVNIGITGFGPIGQYHLKMCQALLGEKINRVFIYDIRPIQVPAGDKRIVAVDSWEEAYTNADIFITCTVSDAPYIDKRPKPGSLHLNVSLRDYKTTVYEWFRKGIIVDDWAEVCRERTDIEMMHLEKGLQQKDTWSITDLLLGDCLQAIDPSEPILFNPMGMAVFDIAMAHYYYSLKTEALAVALH